MAQQAESQSGEKVQIATLTFAMTGGGFALLTLILAAFMNPSAATRVTQAESQYTSLTKLLQKPEMRSLRAQAKLSEGQGPGNMLDVIVRDAMKAYGLDYTQFPPAKPKTLKPGLDEVSLKISLKPAPLASILQFVGLVQDAKKTIQVETVNVTRSRRTTSGEDEDSWTADVSFVDYVVQKG